MDNQFPKPGSIKPPAPPTLSGSATDSSTSTPASTFSPPPVAPAFNNSNSLSPATAKGVNTRRINPIIFIIPVVLILIIGAVFIIRGMNSEGSSSSTSPVPAKTNSTKTVTINYFGLWEPSQVMKPVIEAFEKQNPNIKVNYLPQSSQDYQERLLTNLASQTPPDVFRGHTTWLPLLAKYILPAPANTISSTEISTNFYPIVSKLLVSNNQVYGVPVTVEGLGLFINTSMLKQKQINTPKTWEDLVTAAKSLTEIEPTTSKITRAGVALGNTSNVDHWPDIVSLMLLQAGVKMTNMKSPEVQSTLDYYTKFVTKLRVWDETLPPSTVAFANEKVAMIFAPSWRAREIKAMNPSLSWEVVPVPQLPDVEPLNWASIWFETVSKETKYPQEAWKFVSFLASANAQQVLFDSASTERSFPQAPANKAAASVALKNPVIAPFVSSMDSATSFYTASMTRDSKTALNSRLIKYLEDAVNSFTLNQDGNKIVETLDNGFTQVLSEYGLVTKTAPTTSTP